MQQPQVRVTRKGADRVASGHPWIFSSDVSDKGSAQPGDAVVVVDPRRCLLGMAHFSSASQITLRMLSERVEPIGRAFYSRRLAEAAAFRGRCVAGSDAFRLVFGEADRLPGLVVDRYGQHLVFQTLDQGMDRARDEIVSCLREMFNPAAIVARNDVPVRARESLPLESEVVYGEAPELVEFSMNGLRLATNLLGGQKTGFFLDQRENYLAAARHGRGAALDCFTCTGGFALHLARSCESVEAVDSSAEALRMAVRNRDANAMANVSFREANCFDLLAAYASARRRFSTVVLDPPAFAKSRGNVDAAARGYKEINLRAMQLLDSEGVLITCSCSHHVSEADFLQIIALAALDAGKVLRVLERRTQSSDHPILLTVPETHYLKCVVLEVI